MEGAVYGERLSCLQRHVESTSGGQLLRRSIRDATLTTSTVVGHLPKEISKECCLFIHHGGSITGVVKAGGAKPWNLAVG